MEGVPDGVGEMVGVFDGVGEFVGVPVGVIDGEADGSALTGARATPRNSVEAPAVSTSVGAQALVQLAGTE